jgi:hypothetical protein
MVRGEVGAAATKAGVSLTALRVSSDCAPIDDNPTIPHVGAILPSSGDAKKFTDALISSGWTPSQGAGDPDVSPEDQSFSKAFGQGWTSDLVMQALSGQIYIIGSIRGLDSCHS